MIKRTDFLNEPFRNSIVKLGATEEGVLRNNKEMHSNRRRNTIYSSILNSEW